MDMTLPARKRGRPPIANPAKHRINFRVTRSQRDGYQAAAQAAGLTLTAYIESLLDRAPMPPLASDPVIAEERTQALTADAVELARSWMSLDPRDREVVRSLVRRLID